LSVSGPIWGMVNAGGSYVRQTRWDGDKVQLLGLSLSTPLWRRVSLSASVNKRLDADKSWAASVSVNIQLENGLNTAAHVERGIDGRFAGAVSAAQNRPAGPGLGWRLQASTIENQRAQGALQYNTN